ncbi:hypothetical protein [Frankia sp. CcWB2]
MIEVATLAGELGCPISVHSCDEFYDINGDRTEFCLGGPESNPRTGGHLATHLPGVAVRPIAPGQPDSGAFVVGERRFLLEKGRREYALVARFTPPGSTRPVILICGQTAVTNRAAVYGLKQKYRDLARTIASVDRFCIIFKIELSSTYGYQAVRLDSDVTVAAFTDR